MIEGMNRLTQSDQRTAWGSFFEMLAISEYQSRLQVAQEQELSLVQSQLVVNFSVLAELNCTLEMRMTSPSGPGNRRRKLTGNKQCCFA
jgi:hypothetical protein